MSCIDDKESVFAQESLDSSCGLATFVDAKFLVSIFAELLGKVSAYLVQHMPATSFRLRRTMTEHEADGN